MGWSRVNIHNANMHSRNGTNDAEGGKEMEINNALLDVLYLASFWPLCTVAQTGLVASLKCSDLGRSCILRLTRRKPANLRGDFKALNCFEGAYVSHANEPALMPSNMRI